MSIVEPINLVPEVHPLGLAPTALLFFLLLLPTPILQYALPTSPTDLRAVSPQLSLSTVDLLPMAHFALAIKL